jgi:hypothetical protein
VMPATAPRFSDSPVAEPSAPGADGDAREWALAWGVGPGELAGAL